jgi:hypothetical protein
MAIRTRRRSTLKQAVANNAPPTPANASAVWWADDIAQADGSQVATWTDRINNISVIQATANARPLYAIAGVNGRPSVNFDGSNDFLGLGSSLSSALAGSVVAVVQINNPLLGQSVWSSSCSSENYRYILGTSRYNTGGEVETQQANGGSDDIVRGSVSVPAMTLAVLEWSSSGTAYMHRLNNSVSTMMVGAGTNSGDWFGDVSLTNRWSIGALVRLGGTISFFGGKIAYLGVFDSPLSTQDRYDLYKWIEQYYGITGMPGLSDYEQIVLADSPVAFWPMQEASGSIIDSLASRSGASVGSAKTYQQSGPVTGVNSISFDGSSSSGFSVADDNLWSSTSFSVEGWVYMSSAFLSGQSLRYWFAKEYSGYNEWQMMVSDYGGGAIRHAGAVKNTIDTAFAQTDDPTNRTEQTWYHVVCTFNGSSTGVILYINGSQVDASAGSGSRRPNGSGVLTIGWSPDVAARSWKGRLSMIAFYSSVLTPGQVLAHYQAMS